MTKRQAANALIGRYASAPLNVFGHQINGDVLTIDAQIGDWVERSFYGWSEGRGDWVSCFKPYERLVRVADYEAA